MLLDDNFGGIENLTSTLDNSLELETAGLCWLK